MPGDNASVMVSQADAKVGAGGASLARATNIRGRISRDEVCGALRQRENGCEMGSVIVAYSIQNHDFRRNNRDIHAEHRIHKCAVVWRHIQWKLGAGWRLRERSNLLSSASLAASASMYAA